MIRRFASLAVACIAAVAGAQPDWLIDPAPYEASVTEGSGRPFIRLGNGLVQRTFWIGPNLATVSLDQLATGESLLRAVKPEARVTIDGHAYDADSNRIALVDKRSNTTRLAYDGSGNVLVITDTLGYTTAFTYDARNNPIIQRDALGRLTTLTSDAQGNLTAPGSATVFLNGVLVQENTPLPKKGPGCRKESICGPGPLLLQDHSGFPNAPHTVMKFRNIWLRKLE